ncbi:MAG: 23S rRNA (guanosine(2251)-2'-O)-methyltransferase RlmB [Rhodospirillales bacterium]|nr:23S rRNA (guanosine(2251)-2'-O)-methyltransferase RlmB [Rhodospirillales bacterium]
MRQRKHPRPARGPAPSRQASVAELGGFQPPAHQRARPARDVAVGAAPSEFERAAGGLWLYGRHAVLAAIANPRRDLDRLLVVADLADALARAAAGAASQTGVRRPPVEVADRRTIEAVLPEGAVHQGLAALARPLAAVDLEALIAKLADDDRALVVVLDQVTDPRNVGAVLRSAEAFAAAAVIAQDRHAPDESGPLAKAASGALEAVPLVRVVNLARTLRSLKDAGFFCIGLAGEASARLGDLDLGGRTALVLGAEGDGLRRLVRETCDGLARIPIAPGIDSLNLSAAAAIALYECARARALAETAACAPPGC